MPLTTKAFDAQDALVTALQASNDLSDWEIDYGLPAVRPTQLNIWVAEEVADWVQDLATTGLVNRDESFRLSVYIWAQRYGATAQEVRDEVTAAGGVVEQIVGSAPFLGGVVLFAQVAGGEYDGSFADAEGRARIGVLKLTIACQSYLTA